jgi:hypothetical protein
MPSLWIIARVSFQRGGSFLLLPQLKEDPGKSSLEMLVLGLRVDRLLGDLKSFSVALLQRVPVQRPYR